MLGLSFLYCVVFVALVCLQFSKKENSAPRVKTKPASSKPASNQFDPAAFTLAQARNAHAFNEALGQWRDQAFSYWNRGIPAQADEETVIAYCGESLRRDSYKSTLAAIPSAFLESSRRSYESSVYLGGMASALRSFTRAENEKISRILHTINEKSPDFLLQDHVFKSLFVRGHVNIAEDGLEVIRSIESANLDPAIFPGIFEGYMDIRQCQPHGENPFERLIDPVCRAFSGSLRKDAENDLVFAFKENVADSEYNLRLGKALFAWAEATGKGSWANLGRSLILSVLSMRDNTGSVPAAVQISESGKIQEGAGGRISAAKIYRNTGPGEYYPQATEISGAGGLWAWTIATQISARQRGDVLEISVHFPVGETHHMMIRGVRPFTKIQLYDMDYRTDPEFEQYDSSGWVYSAQEQILVLKMKHRSSVEYIRIYY
jgi:hypothetical protein